MSAAASIWEVPYLPIDPSDIGREYEPIVRINSQSGKGGVAFVMDTFYGFKLPKGMHKEFADVIQKISEKQGEVAPEQIMDEFKCKLPGAARSRCTSESAGSPTRSTRDGAVRNRWPTVTYTDSRHREVPFEGVGNGPIDAVQRGDGGGTWHRDPVCWTTTSTHWPFRFRSTGSVLHPPDGCKESGKATYGVGISSNITRASIRGGFSAVS